MSQSLSDLQQSVPSDIRELLLQQLNSWQQGTRLPIETIMMKAKPEHRVAAAQVLIKQEIVLREKAGEVPCIDEYISRFPECADSLPRDLANERELTMAMQVIGIQPDQFHNTNSYTIERTFTNASVSSLDSALNRIPSNVEAGNSDLTKSGAQKKSDSVNRMIGMYRLEKKLGQGGMGAVFKAVHTKLDKTVAIKVMSRQGTLDDTAVERFEREMRAVGRIEHPNVIRAMDAGEADGFHFLVMEYVEGIDVSQAVKANGPFPIGQACEIIRQAALGLHEAHLLGLVHRDIKPSNLLLTKKGVVKILDLGLARLSEGQLQNPELTQSGLCMGTPDYMAPEQWVSARDVDGRCDFYALGCTLFHVLIGRPPFGTKEHLSLGNKVLAHTSGVIPDIRLLCADFPEELKPIVDRMLAKERDQRYLNGADLALALQPFCRPLPGADNSSHSEITSLRPATPRKPESPRWKRLLAYWGGGAAVLALAGFIVIKITDKNGRETEVSVPEGAIVSVNIKNDDGSSTETVITPKTKSATGLIVDANAKRVPVKSEAELIKAAEKKKAASGTTAIAARSIPVGDVTDPMVNPKMERGNPGKTGTEAASVPGETPAPQQPTQTTQKVVVVIDPPMNPVPAVEKLVPAAPLRLPMSAEAIAKQQAAWSRDLKRPVTRSNSLRIPIVLIPPGEFDMGVRPDGPMEPATDSASAEFQARAAERPRHHVKITRPFAIGQHEVTVQQYRQFVASTQYKTLAERETATGITLSEGISQKKRVRSPGFSWQFAGEVPLDDDQPVTNLSWYDAVAFCDWLSLSEGVTYRLPTEAEWEYVARAGAGSVVEGSDIWVDTVKQGANLGDIAGSREFSQVGFVNKSVDWDDTFAAQAPVGRFTANVLGLQDFCGNVAEWCSDRYDAEYYKTSPLENPRGAAAGRYRVIRGSSWQSSVADCRPELRSFAAPNRAQLNVGFRIVQELPTLAESEAAKTAPTPAQRDLAIAEWILNLGGKVRLALNRAPSNEISKTSELPKIGAGIEYTIYSINLAETGIGDQGLTRLKVLTGLQELNLSGNPITDSSLEKLVPFRFLQKLNLSQTQVTGSGLNLLANSRKLIELDLSGCPVTDTSLSPIQGLTSLTVVRMNSTAIADDALELLKSLPLLKELALADTRVTGSGLVHLKNMANLTTLDLSQTPLVNQSLTGLANLKSLRQLKLNWSTVNDIGLTNLQDSYALSDVGLRGTETDDFNIDMLQKLKAIRKLDLRETDFTETGVAGLEKSLKTKISASVGDVDARVASLCLSVGGQVVIAADREAPAQQTVTQLNGLPTSRFIIREIHLDNSPVSDGVLLMVPKLRNLKVLRLGGTNIDDAGVALLARAPKLESLNLDGTRISDQSLSQIAGIKTLKALSVRDTRLPEDKIAELRAKLPGVEIQ
jgi:formylglycine-generating enzyme required for sulfatase activity/serine/threonine protein kinase/Leucine-rich repeat (LRR) protein